MITVKVVSSLMDDVGCGEPNLIITTNRAVTFQPSESDDQILISGFGIFVTLTKHDINEITIEVS